MAIDGLTNDEMTKCVFCGAETELRVNGTPMCAKCDQKQEQKRAEAEDEKKKPVKSEARSFSAKSQVKRLS
jgi:hypothetical protein